MKSKSLTLVGVLVVAFLVCACTLAQAAEPKRGPGKVALTFMERVESQSDSGAENGDVSPETYLYSMISAYRKLDTKVAGSIFYMNKWSLDNDQKISDIFGISLTRELTGKWKGDMGYTGSMNQKRDTSTFPIEVDQFTISRRFSFGLEFKINPGEKKRKRYTTKTTFGTGSDFGTGTTLAQKIDVKDDISKRWSYTATYQFVWGLSETNVGATNICSTCSEHYNNQYQLDVKFKMNKQHSVTLGYMFLKNLFNAAARPNRWGHSTGDNQFFRLSYNYTH